MGVLDDSNVQGLLNGPVNAAQAGSLSGQNLLSSQSGQNQDYLGRLRSYVSSQPSTGVIAAKLGSQLGLPQLQANANQLNQAVTDLPSTYGSATRGFDVNANQLSRIIGQKSSVLAPLAQTATTQAQNAQNQVNTQLGYNQQDFQNQLIPYTSEANILGQQQSNQINVWGQSQKNDLDALVAKMQSGTQLTNDELNRANQLSIAELQSQTQQNVANSYIDSSRYQKPADTSYQTIGGRTKLIDNRTGAVISDLGTSAAPNSGYSASANPSSYYGSGWS